jgi:pyridoxal phosphate enzyme (YggS family)
MDSIATRIDAVREQIAAAARRAGRTPEEVRLVAVTKTHPPDVVARALAAGLRDFGENRVQEAEPKIAALAAERQAITWHMIGHLQSNKARRAAALFDIVHSVDSLRLAAALARGVGSWELGAGRSSPNSQPPTPNPLPVLLQVNVSGEASKEGFALAGWEQRPDLLDGFFAEVERLLALPGLAVRGLMTIAPWGDDPEAARPTFRSARQLRDALARRFPTTDWSALSMGMTDDFAVAIEEGATLVRVGRAIFGERERVSG